MLELPATYLDDLGEATYTIVTPPVWATIIGGEGPYRVLQAEPGPPSDRVTFRVTTPSGSSQEATITLHYTDGPRCPADLNLDGSLDIFDVVQFLEAFAAFDALAAALT